MAQGSVSRRAIYWRLFCGQLISPPVSATRAGGTTVPKAAVSTVDPATGSGVSATCGLPAASTTPILSGRGYRIRQPNVAGAPTSVIIVGSHSPSLQIHLEDAGNGQQGDNWISVPYH